MSDPHIAMQARKTAEIFEERVCGNILPVGARRDRNRQQQAETARKRLKGEPGRTGKNRRTERDRNIQQAGKNRQEKKRSNRQRAKKIGGKGQRETAKTERSRNREKDVKKLPAGEINFDGSGILAQ